MLENETYILKWLLMISGKPGIRAFSEKMKLKDLHCVVYTKFKASLSHFLLKIKKSNLYNDFSLTHLIETFILHLALRLKRNYWF